MRLLILQLQTVQNSFLIGHVYFTLKPLSSSYNSHGKNFPLGIRLDAWRRARPFRSRRAARGRSRQGAVA